MTQITVLRSSSGQPQCKTIYLEDGKLTRKSTPFVEMYDVEVHDVHSLAELSTLLRELETHQDKFVIRGRLKDPENKKDVRRLASDASAPLTAQDCQWLCIDVDKLDLPEELSDFNRLENEIALYIAQRLPTEFRNVDFHWHFSSGMGVEPGIKMHLWFWLDRPVSDREAKGWLTNADFQIDESLFQANQAHFTSNPIISESAYDPVAVRSGLYRFEDGKASVPVPDDLEQKVEEFAKRSRGAVRQVRDGIIDPYGIVRDENGQVIDGREKFLFLKSVDATRILMSGRKETADLPSLEEIAGVTWELFEAEAVLSDGRWTYQNAVEKAGYRLRSLEAGWRPKERGLVPGVEPYFDLEPMPVAEGNEKLHANLDDFFASVADREAQKRKMALRVTMGAGKTTVAIEKIKALLAENPNLNIEYYVPTHDLAGEIVERFEGIDASIHLIHVRGRNQGHETGNAPCVRYAYAQSLARQGLSVRSNACQRADDQRCEHFNDCAYFKQFRPHPFKSGAVRVFASAYLKERRPNELPEPDLVVIDEAFLPAIIKTVEVSDPRLRQLLNNASGDSLGDDLVNALRDGLPVLKKLREKGFDHARLTELEVDTSINIRFDPNTSGERNFPAAQDARERFEAAEVLETLTQEMANESRDDVERLRYDDRNFQVILVRIETMGIPEDAHMLFLDATADYSILNHLFGAIEFHRVDFEQRAYVTQVYDTQGTNHSWNTKEDQVDDLVAVIGTHTEIGHKILCVSHKALADQLRMRDDLGSNVGIAHFQAIRGIDEFKGHDSVFITGRHQAPQHAIDGLARAVWWNDETPLFHEAAAEINAPPSDDLERELRGYLTADPDDAAGVYVRSFRDPRIEAIHKQTREAETVQAIARLRLVHAETIKNVYLLGNLPIEIPVNRLISWNELMLNDAERDLLKFGNVPLTARGWREMRPDLELNEDRAKKHQKRHGINDHSAFLEASPHLVRMGCVAVKFRPVEDGKPGRYSHAHLFKPDLNDGSMTTKSDGLVKFLENGDPNIEGSGWGPIKVEDVFFFSKPGDTIAFDAGEEKLQ